MPQLTRDCLSEHDQAVLDSIFNPLQIGGDTPNILDIQLSEEVQDPPEPLSPEIQESSKLELEAIQVAESGNLERALELFTKAIKCAPERASPYNNRAQTYRLQGQDEAAFTDLQKALELSSYGGRTGCRALCQRGVLFRKKEDLDSARKDFEMAGNLGSKFAKTQLIEINPYAAMCNQMLRDAFEKLS